LGYATPKTATGEMLAVFFEGVNKDKAISVKDMDWTLIDEKCNQLQSIGFGIHASTSAEPVIFIGELTSGSITLEGGAKPLVALVFVAPEKTMTVTLRGPQGKEYKAPVSANWLPGDENSITGINVLKDGFIKVPLAGGENWTQSGASVTPQP